MKLVGKPRLVEFAEDHADVREQIRAWTAEVEDANWESPHELRERYASVSFLGNGRTVFNLKGNDYRLGVKINYEAQIVVVQRMGTHSDYDNWDW